MSTLIQADLDRVAGLPSREAAAILGVAKTTVNEYRKIARKNGGTLPLGNGTVNHKVIHVNDGTDGSSSSVETRRDGSLAVETSGDTPQTKDEVDAAMLKRGFDPAEYEFTYRFSEWQAQRAGGELITMYAARAGATPKRSAVKNEALDVTELLDTVRDWTFTPLIKDERAPADLGMLFADPQLGKVDANGGSEGTINRIMTGFARVAEIAKEEKPHDILFADLGDGLENFYNTAQQRETNDLDLTSQVRVLRRIQLEGIRMLAPLCKRLRHRSVPSNHGGVRINFQQQASTESNDWGLEVSHQLEDVIGESAIDNVDFGRTDGKHAVSLRVDLENNSRIGMTHGDQAGTQPRMGTWWMGQAFGWDNPLRDVDMLLYGHFHNENTEEVSRGRWMVGAASTDPGSAWFENRTGRSATAGMTTFLTAAGTFWDLRTV